MPDVWKRPFAKWWTDAACVSLLAVLPYALYRKALTLAWMFDDAFLLGFVQEHRGAELLISPAAWRGLPFRMFIPVLMLSYKADLTTFGLVPKPFYIHQLVALTIATILLFATLRLWFSPLTSLTGSTLFLLLPGMVEWSAEVMLRHCVEGLSVACVSTLLFVVSVRRRSLPASLLAAGAYLIAALCKEIFVPLPIMFLVLPDGTLRNRVARAWPSLVAAGAYAIWRFLMIGTLLGGYGWAVRPREWPRLMPSFLVHFTELLFSLRYPLAWILFVVWAAAVAWLAWSRTVRLSTVLVIAALTVGPLIPIAKGIEVRHTVMAGLLVIVIILVAIERVPISRRVVAAAVVVLVLAAFVVNRHEWNASFARDARMSSEAEAFLQLGPNDVLWKPIVPPAAMASLAALKTSYLRRSPGTAWTYDEIGFCQGQLRGKEFYASGGLRGEVVKMTDRVNREAGRFCGSLISRPITCDFWKEGDALVWNIGPESGGKYTFVLGDGQQAFEMPRQGAYQIGPMTALALRIRYDSPQRWVTYSPLLNLDLTSGRHCDCASPKPAAPRRVGLS